MKPVALAIAGSDPTGRAGIAADLRTFAALGVHGAFVITALTAQTDRAVHTIRRIGPRFIKAQLQAVFAQFRVEAVKIGMVWRGDVIEEVEATLAEQGQQNVVLDPVWVASSGRMLIDENAIEPLKKRLFPRALLLTPNLFEAAIFSGSRNLAQTEEEMRAQGEQLLSFGAKAVLVKGGHGTGTQAVDLLVEPERVTRFTAKRIPGHGMRGSGCVLSSAIAAGLAKGLGLHDAIRAAKAHVTVAIAAAG
jgi:hydroxymethylpyrimidine/phosphomethylpyrimidine kinase